MTESTATHAEIEALETELMEKARALAALRRALPAEPVEDYVLAGPDGEDVPLSSLFGDKDDLIVVHNMGRSCPFCTLWADGFNGIAHHMQDRAALVVVSPDAPEEQAAFAASRGWTFRMLSNGASGFTEAMGFMREQEGNPSPWPGCSTFRRRDDGSIVRIARADFGPGDPYCSAWHLFDLLDDGVGTWMPKFSYA